MNLRICYLILAQSLFVGNSECNFGNWCVFFSPNREFVALQRLFCTCWRG